MGAIKITTIGGGNGQSNLLDGLNLKFGDKIKVSSIVSMSDDGRTTGELMRLFDSELGLHLPPPGDLRRCLFSLSKSKHKDYFKFIFELQFLNEKNISDFSIFDLFSQAHKEILFLGKKVDFLQEIEDFSNKKGKLFKYLENKMGKFFEFKLPLNSQLKGHKFGNILMASLYFNLEKDYDKMLDFMHDLLEVEADVIPVTIKKAFIKAVLGNGEIVETQDRISNEANYKSGIADLELMDSSHDARHHKKVKKALLDADFILIGPGDLFTSIISNFIISGVSESIKETKAKIIYIGNNTNKGGETMGLTQLDFVNKIERFLGKKIDFFVVNNRKLNLTENELLAFKNNISVKGGDFLYVSKGEKYELERKKIKLIEADLLDEESFYKHSKTKLLDVLEKIFFK